MIFAAVAALMMSACTNEAQEVTATEEATLQVQVLGEASDTRATGTLPGEDDDNTITRVTVGLFDKATGKTDVISEGTLDANKRIEIKGTEGDRDIIVVANAPAKTFAGVMTIADFRTKTLSLTQDKTLIPMSGESTASVALVGGEKKTADVEISRLVARVQLISVKTAFDASGQYANASFKMDKVFLYNAKSTSTVAATPVTTDLVHGHDGQAVGVASLLDAITAVSIGTDAITTPYYYYAFANGATKATATKLVIAGYFKADATSAEVYVYYPGVINRAQDGTDIDGNTDSHTGIVRNNTYSVKATIKSIGVDSPAKFMEPAALDLGITVAKWKLNLVQEIDF